MSNSQRNTVVLQPGVEGYFAWVRGLGGKPCCEKYHATERHQYLSRTEWVERTLQTIPLNKIEWEFSLDTLAEMYPLKVGG